ncbi:MAG: nuclear transport factor 2 family protein [Bacteroidales bacterium]|nr:nuclear transport factor 2 family protein [Bacteroidales bacterium]
MKSRLLSFLIVLVTALGAIAQDTKPQFSAAEQELIDLSNNKWQWMSDKNTDKLADLFHDTAQFVHMGGYWGKEAELNTIKEGHIWYKKAEIHNQEVKFTDNTATVYSVIHLNSEVGGNAVRFPFIVTEVYVKENDKWLLSSLVFTKTLGE